MELPIQKWQSLFPLLNEILLDMRISIIPPNMGMVYEVEHRIVQRASPSRLFFRWGVDRGNGERQKQKADCEQGGEDRKTIGDDAAFVRRPALTDACCPTIKHFPSPPPYWMLLFSPPKRIIAPSDCVRNVCARITGAPKTHRREARAEKGGRCQDTINLSTIPPKSKEQVGTIAEGFEIADIDCKKEGGFRIITIKAEEVMDPEMD